MPPRIARLVALGAFAVAAGILALFLWFVFVTRPGASSGLDATERFVTWLSVAGVVAVLMGVHVVVGRQLLALARGEVRPV